MTSEPARPTAEDLDRAIPWVYVFEETHLRPNGIELTAGARANLENAVAPLLALAAQAQRDEEAVARLEARCVEAERIANEALDRNVRQDFAYLGERDDALDQLAHAIFWLLRAYESGHRQGWEPGPSTQETMDGLFTWLCNAGFDPTTGETPAFVPAIRAALGPEDTRHA